MSVFYFGANIAKKNEKDTIILDFFLYLFELRTVQIYSLIFEDSLYTFCSYQNYSVGTP